MPEVPAAGAIGTVSDRSQRLVTVLIGVILMPAD
jgi:hypothetical protein